jgi:flagellar assembly protein FliH
MKPWLKAIQLSQPLREVHCVVQGTLLSAELAGTEQRQREGERAAHQQLIQQRDDLLELQSGVLASLHQTIPRIMRECESTLITLALEAAQKLVAGLPISAEMVEANVREALAQVAESAELKVYLHPQDLELLKRVNSTLFAGDSVERIQFRSSPEVTRGGCLVQTGFGVIDARPETKFELLKKSLQA